MKQLITIGLGTMNRPEMLRQALSSLIELKQPENFQVQLIVCENGASDLGEGVFNELAHKIPYNSVFIREEKAGIVFMRNAILDQAKQNGSNFLAFFDDDEVVDKNWLINLNDGRIKFSADVVQGHVQQQFPEVSNLGLITKFFPGSFECEDGTELNEAYTNNVLFDVQLANKYGIEFNDRFNKMGGSDSFFFSQMKEKGAKIVFAKEAILTETVPVSRANLNWIMSRFYRNGYVNYHINELKLGRMKAIKKTFKSVKIFFKGTSVSGHLATEKDVLERKKFLWAKGMVYAMLGLSYREYDKIHGS